MTPKKIDRRRNTRVPRANDPKKPARFTLSQAASEGRKDVRKIERLVEKAIMDRATKLFHEMDIVGYVREYCSKGDESRSDQTCTVPFPEEVLQEIDEYAGHIKFDSESWEEALERERNLGYFMTWDEVLSALGEIVEKDGFKLADSWEYDSQYRFGHSHPPSYKTPLPCEVCGKTWEQTEQSGMLVEWCHIEILVPS